MDGCRMRKQNTDPYAGILKALYISVFVIVIGFVVAAAGHHII